MDVTRKTTVTNFPPTVTVGSGEVLFAVPPSGARILSILVTSGSGGVVLEMRSPSGERMFAAGKQVTSAGTRLTFGAGLVQGGAVNVVTEVYDFVGMMAVEVPAGCTARLFGDNPFQSDAVVTWEVPAGYQPPKPPAPPKPPRPIYITTTADVDVSER